MSQIEQLTEVLLKYGFRSPVSTQDQKKILKAKKRALSAILNKERKKSLFTAPLVGLYYVLKNINNSVTLAGIARLINTAFISMLLIITLGTAFTLHYTVFLREPAVLTEAIFTFTMGDVTIIREGKEPVKARIKDIVTTGDSLSTGLNSWAVLQAGSSLLFKVMAESDVSVVSLFEDNNAQVRLNGGKIISKLLKLPKETGYIIETRNCYAAVRGTEFSVSYQPLETIVAVKEGTVLVQLRDITVGTVLNEKPVSAGYTAVVTDRIVIRKNTIVESLELETISLSPIITRAWDKSSREMKKTWEKPLTRVSTVEKKINAEKGIMTIDEIREKYGRIDTITLYNGRVIRGSIISRGAVVTVQTAGGIIRIPKKKIKYTR